MQLVLKGFCCLAGAVLLSRTSNAQEGSTPTLSTDRPSVAAGTDLVPYSWIVVENGLGIRASTTAFSVDAPESLVRHGIARGLELRWGVPVFTRSSTSSQLTRGDGSVTAKVRLPESAWPVAAIVGSTVPIASPGHGSGAWDPTLLLTGSHAWTPRLFSIATYNMYWTSSPVGPRNRSQQYAFELGWNASSTTTAFVEEAPLLSSQAAQAGYTADAGLLWMRKPIQQWDVRMGYSRTGTTGQVIAGVGLSFMLPSHTGRGQ